uniref:DUF4283 domain-containing protein n=2 Tax=Brassica oleracea var. oleracea TaxID=109376 RepID=A0A0D3CKA9_BRAOL
MSVHVATVKVAEATVPAPTITDSGVHIQAMSSESRACLKSSHKQKKITQTRKRKVLWPHGVTKPKELNKRSWDSFVLGQFYHEPPSQGTIFKIVNGIWSRNRRDITVSKMEGFAFLFRISNASTRNHVIKQGLWQIEGQTMFVDKWEPGVVPAKPELSEAPIWLELRNVPLQFFNEDGLERIAGLVGHPKYLHPNTANKTVLDVAKVFTVIDPRKPLPEAVNVQFDSGDIARITVSSPWMPHVCEICHEIGHTTKRCKQAPITCANCRSSTHTTDRCTRTKLPDAKRKTSRRFKNDAPAQIWQPCKTLIQDTPAQNTKAVAAAQSTKTMLLQGDSSGLTPAQKSSQSATQEIEPEGTEDGKSSGLEPDSSDTYSTEFEEDP